LASDLVLAPDARVKAWLRSDGLAALVQRGTAADAAVHDRHRLWHVMILEFWLREWCR